MMDRLRELTALYQAASPSMRGATIGVILGLIFLFFGFWKTVGFVLFVGLGYGIGRWAERAPSWRQVVDRIRSGRVRD